MTIGVSPYKMTLDLNVLNHLGINLYSNVPAVIAEVVANSWDADALNVWIEIDKAGGRIVITDDGFGMTLKDINDKYLTVGYQKRANAADRETPVQKRHVMGRKGIGKLSLFSIADVIEVQSIKDGQRNGFRMSSEGIQLAIKRENGVADYHPDPVDPSEIGIAAGTRIILTRIKKDLAQTSAGLRKRLSRRFGIIGDEFHFSIKVDGEPVTIDDRDYFHKLQYLWRYGDDSEKYMKWSKNLEKDNLRDGKIAGADFKVTGWIGTSKESGQLKDKEDNLNRIMIMVRGKLAQEDILEEFAEGGVYASYVIGEINADFLDMDGKDDIATTSRQKIIEDDPRYQALRTFIQTELKNIQNLWTSYRNEQGTKKAEQIPAIKEWLKELSPDHRRKANSLFGKINQLRVDSEDERRSLFKHAVLAFESLRYKENLEALDTISLDNLAALTEVFVNLDDIEATLYHQIVNERVQVIKTLKEKVEDNALEKVVQEHLFQHLWLLDPSWERATGAAYMEERVKTEFDKIDGKLSDNEKSGRIDIKYTTTSGKHVVVELKRANRVVSTTEIIEQLTKYRTALRKLLREAGREKEPIEFVCIVGKDLKDWAEEDGRQVSEDQLKAIDARVVQYTRLIDGAYKQYQQFLDKSEQVGRVSKLIKSIDVDQVS